MLKIWNGEPSLLTEEQLKYYDDNGFLVIENVFSPRECERIVGIYEARADKDFKGIMNLDRELPEIRKVVTHPVMVNAMETLQRAEVALLQSMFLFKKAQSAYASQAWNPHQDNAYPQAKVGAYITANICFTDQDPENGGMFIYAGSHKEGFLPFKPVKSFHEKPGESPGHVVEVPPKYKKEDLLMKKGCVLFLHGCVIHGSYPNTSKKRSRPMLLIPYITKGEKFVPGAVAQRMEQTVR